jgi:hypothetical protein
MMNDTSYQYTVSLRSTWTTFNDDTDRNNDDCCVSAGCERMRRMESIGNNQPSMDGAALRELYCDRTTAGRRGAASISFILTRANNH